MNSLIFNLTKETVIQYKGAFDLIDLRYSITNSKNMLQNLIDLDIVAPIGTDLYKKFIAELLKDEELLSIKVSDFSVYWITDCAIKGYAWHWGRDFFILIAILQEYQSQFENNYKELVFYLPEEWSYLKKTISTFLNHLEYKVNYTIVEVKPKRKSTNYWLDFLRLNKSIVKILFDLSKLKSISCKEANNLIFLSIGKISSKDDLFSSLKQLFNESNKKLSNIPFFWKCDGVIPYYFYRFKPSFIQQVKFWFSIIKAYLKVVFFKGKDIKIGSGLNFSASFIKDDLIKTFIGRSHLLFFYIWIKKYFSSLNKLSNIYIDDEFYQTGRIISQAASQFPKIKSYGLQHGHFMESHTVYVITQAEIDAGLPMPDNFITWGEHYNQMFLKHNSLPSSYVLPLGKPNYVLNQNRDEYPKLVNNILWCLTTRECMEYEWKIIEEQITSMPWRLSIRLHPLPHILKSDVSKLLGKEVPYTFDNSSTIMEAIRKNDLILVSAHSTTFLDSIFRKKYCVRLKSRFWDGEEPVNISGLYTVSSVVQFKKAVQEVVDGNGCNESSVSFIELASNKWNKFINGQ